jgi:hypothetical protein
VEAIGGRLPAVLTSRIARVRSFVSEFRACLSEVLRGPVPEPATGDDPMRFFKQWLAERNLGLVAIHDAGSFDWPGQWIGMFRDGEREHAVVMFGSPSGVWLDPGSAYDDQRIDAGWMVTALDLHLPAERPYGTVSAPGTVAAILIAADAEAPLFPVDEAEALAGHGLAGDRYATGNGTFSGPGRGYQLTLVEAEVLDEIELGWEQARRNIVTRGISLNGLVGRRFRVGAVECIGRRLAEPCAHLEKLSGPGLLRPLVHRGGLRADILSGGAVRLGDEVAAVD